MAFSTNPGSMNTYFQQYLKVAANDNVIMEQYDVKTLGGTVRLYCKKCQAKCSIESNLFANEAVPMKLQEFVKTHRHAPIVIKQQPWEQSQNWHPSPGKIVEVNKINDVKPVTPTQAETQIEMLKILLEKKGVSPHVIEQTLRAADEIADKKVEEKAMEPPKGRRFRE